MSGPYRPFDPAEVHVAGEPDPSPAESADALSTARELEALAVSAGVRPTDGFEDRVMAAIAVEPLPRVVVRPRGAVRGGLLGAFALAFRDAWGVASSGGRPFAVRAQALALVLIVVLAAGSLTALGAVTVGGLLDRQSGPSPSVQPGPTIVPTPTSTETAEPTGTAEPTETAEPIETAEPAGTDDHGGGGGDGGGSTAQPTRTSGPTGTDDHGGSGSDGGDGGGSGSDKTAEPTQTPRPTETPRATDDSGGGGGTDDGGAGGSGSE
jgi:hypothetical protein